MQNTDAKKTARNLAQDNLSQQYGITTLGWLIALLMLVNLILWVAPDVVTDLLGNASATAKHSEPAPGTHTAPPATKAPSDDLFDAPSSPTPAKPAASKSAIIDDLALPQHPAAPVAPVIPIPVQPTSTAPKQGIELGPQPAKPGETPNRPPVSTVPVAAVKIEAKKDDLKTVPAAPINVAAITDSSSVLDAQDAAAQQPIANASCAQLPATVAAIIKASACGDIAALRKEMANGGNIQTTDSRAGFVGRTPLHHAVQNGQLAVTDFLIAAGALVNAADAQGNTPLHLAASTDNLPNRRKIAEHLRTAGADINLTNKQARSARALLIESKDKSRMKDLSPVFSLNAGQSNS